MTYTPPATTAMDFDVEIYSAPTTTTMDFDVGDSVSTPVTLTGASTPTGTVVKEIDQTKLTGGITPSGTIVKSMSKATLVGSSTPTGTVQTQYIAAGSGVHNLMMMGVGT